jgi:hypothetical protein
MFDSVNNNALELNNMEKELVNKLDLAKSYNIRIDAI